MSLFTVDQKECRRDGLCVAECPAKLIEIIGKEGFPTPIDGTSDRQDEAGITNGFHLFAS